MQSSSNMDMRIRCSEADVLWISIEGMIEETMSFDACIFFYCAHNIYYLVYENKRRRISVRDLISRREMKWFSIFLYWQIVLRLGFLRIFVSFKTNENSRNTLLSKSHDDLHGDSTSNSPLKRSHDPPSKWFKRAIHRVRIFITLHLNHREDVLQVIRTRSYSIY